VSAEGRSLQTKKERLDFLSQPLFNPRQKPEVLNDYSRLSLEAEAGSQGNDTAGKSTGNCAEIRAANVVGDLVGVKV
jgi:hypothetical protein